jgi:mRNA-degrading endonuclease RelE of RelBE toxin-antitoxin system
MPRRGGKHRAGEGGQATDHTDAGVDSGAATPWRIRFAEAILTEDLAGIGHAALVVARNVIDKKLKVAPEQYGARLHKPLHGLWKLKTSHVRIVYHVEVAAHEVWILMIGARRDIWNEDQETILTRLQAFQKSEGSEQG